MTEIIEQLKKVPLFESLGDEDLEAVSQVVKLKSFPKNTILFSEGDESDSFYVICEGRVNVGINDEDPIVSRLRDRPVLLGGRVFSFVSQHPGAIFLAANLRCGIVAFIVHDQQIVYPPERLEAVPNGLGHVPGLDNCSERRAHFGISPSVRAICRMAHHSRCPSRQEGRAVRAICRMAHRMRNR